MNEDKCIVCHERLENHSQLLEHLTKAHTKKIIIAAASKKMMGQSK